MRFLRLCAVPLLIPLLLIGCNGDSERGETDDLFDMSLLAQDEKGELYAPIKGEVESSNKGDEQPQAVYSMHNHHLGTNAPFAYWLIHRDGGAYHGALCAPVASYQQVCANIALYIGASTGKITGATMNANCPTSAFWNSASCETY